jgi:ribosome biogenesis GTPase A
MSLQWYPGHMTKARRELAALMPSQDVVIEVLDARLPAASSNPLLTELRGAKPCVKVLARSDLADPLLTKAWLRYFGAQSNVAALEATTGQPAQTRQRIAELCHGMARHRGPDKAVRALIAGVPNVGKSTLINVLMQKASAAVGNKPAVTKEQKTFTLPNGMKLCDSPGILWPKIVDERSAFKLALAGSIPDTAIEYGTIAMFGAELLLTHYASLLVTRFKLAAVPGSPELLLNEIGRRRACLRQGGEVDVHKASELFVKEFRAGSIGRISLEAPDDGAW